MYCVQTTASSSLYRRFPRLHGGTLHAPSTVSPQHADAARSGHGHLSVMQDLTKVLLLLLDSPQDQREVLESVKVFAADLLGADEESDPARNTLDKGLICGVAEALDKDEVLDFGEHVGESRPADVVDVAEISVYSQELGGIANAEIGLELCVSGELLDTVLRRREQQPIHYAEDGIGVASPWETEGGVDD